MQVGNNDIFVKNIEKEIKCREKKLENMYINLKNKALENIFLESVLNEYDEYYKNLVDEKNKECHAFQEIYDYLDKINYESKLTEEQIFTSTFDDMKGSDFTSQEKAGLKALKKLSKNLNIDICN